MRYYHKNKEEFPKPPPAPKNRLNIAFQEQASSSGANLVNELQSGCYPNFRRAQWLIQKTYKERQCEFSLSETKSDIIQLYPHIKDAKLVSYFSGNAQQGTN